MNKTRLYKLTWDFTHSGDNEFDASHHPFEKSINTIHYLINPELYEIELIKNPILFQADFSIISIYDYPTNSLRIPIFSKKMIEVVESVGRTQIDWFDIVMVDDTYMEERFDKNGNLNKEVPTNTDFKTFRIKKTEDYINLEQSEYRPLKSNPKAPGRFKKFVLNEPETGFKPIFRTKYIPSSLIVTEEIKNEFENNEIQGCVFNELIYERAKK